MDDPLIELRNDYIRQAKYVASMSKELDSENDKLERMERALIAAEARAKTGHRSGGVGDNGSEGT